MKISGQHYESDVAVAQLLFYCTVTDVLESYNNFVKENYLQIPKPLQNSTAETKIFTDFTQNMGKIVLESFKKLQKDVLEKIKDLESEQLSNKSLSFEYSEMSESPETPKHIQKSRRGKSPQVSYSEKKCRINTRMESHTESKSKIKQITRHSSLVKCLFKN